MRPFPNSNIKIFNYIFQVYPDKDINNIVESNHYTKIGGWCKLGRTKCKGPARWVKPYRCLGKFLYQEVSYRMIKRFTDPKMRSHAFEIRWVDESVHINI